LAKILLIEDDKTLCALVSDWLIGQMHSVESVHDGRKADDLLKLGGFDLIVLDWDLPYKSGLELLRDFRERGGQTPVIMLTAKDALSDKERGLDVGADDYVTKPFAVKELAARIRAILRRPPELLSEVLIRGDIKLDPNKHELTKAGVELRLQPKDFALLEFLMRNPNRIFSTDVLLARVWASESEATADALRTSIKRIRRTIDDTSEDGSTSIIRTIPRVGYTLRSDD